MAARRQVVRVEAVTIRRNQDWPPEPMPYSGDTYYGLPPVKPSHYRWTIATSFFCAGIAGASHILSTVLDAAGYEVDRPLIRAGRLITPAGAVASALLYIKDLGTPGRWFNMLRIFRPTSFMSVGTWSLTMLGLSSGVTAAGQLLDDLGLRGLGRGIARLSSLPALPFGAVVSLYMGTELEETSTPFWANSSPLLPSLFVVNNASNALSLFEIMAFTARVPSAERQRLNTLNILSAIGELALLRGVETKWTKGATQGRLQLLRDRLLYRTGIVSMIKVAAVLVRIVSILDKRNERRLLPLASFITLGAGFLLPAVLLSAGNRSAGRPEDYFAHTDKDRPRHPAGQTEFSRPTRAKAYRNRHERRRRTNRAKWLALGALTLVTGVAAYAFFMRPARGGTEITYSIAAS